MTRWVTVLGGIGLVCGLAGTGNALSINFLAKTDANQGLTSPYAGAMVNTFDAPSTWVWSGNGAVVSGSVSGKYAAPFANGQFDATRYVTVPLNLAQAPASYSASLGGTYNYFGIWWGSMDAYNTLTFTLNGVPTGDTFTGTALVANPSYLGNQTAWQSNRYVNLLGLQPFDGFTMTSTNYAFEADNIAVGNVPEPATVVLLASGLAGIAALRKRRAKA